MQSIVKKYQEPITSKIKEIIGTLSILFNYVVTDTQKKSRSFKIGVFSIFIVVTFLVVLQAALELTPHIFLRLAENESGQADFTLTAVAAQNDTRLSSSSSSDSTPFFRGLNFTDIEEKLKGVPEIAGMAPRWLLPLQVGNPNQPDTIFNVVGIVLDSQKERELGFGSNIDLKDLKNLECWISESTRRLAALTDLSQILSATQAFSTAGTANSTDTYAIARSLAQSFIRGSLANSGARQDPSNPDLYTFGSNTNAPVIKLGRQVNPLDGSGINRDNSELGRLLAEEVTTSNPSNERGMPIIFDGPVDYQVSPIPITLPPQFTSLLQNITQSLNNSNLGNLINSGNLTSLSNFTNLSNLTLSDLNLGNLTLGNQTLGNLTLGDLASGNFSSLGNITALNLTDILNQISNNLNLTGLGLDLNNLTNNFQIQVNTSRFVDALLPSLVQAMVIDVNLTVIESVESPNGKWPKELGNVVVIDSKHVVKVIEDNIVLALQNVSFETGNNIVDAQIPQFLNKTELERQIRDAASQIRVNDYALTANVLLNDRIKIYNSQTTVRPNLIKVSNKIYSILGRSHPSTISSALSTALNAFFIFKNFLDNIFNSTVFILVLLSMLLVYSLMNSNVEEKTYEFGMLRALGLKTVNLTGLLIIQSLFFALPGLVMGLIFSFAINFMVTYYISNLSSIPNSYAPAGSAIGLGIAIALIVPMAANIIPIRKALSKTLRDSLNLYHRTISDITVKIMKLAEIGISPAQTIGSLTLIIMGFLTYYLAPYAFIFQNIPLFFIILNIVMMMMVIGFTLLLNLLQPYVERIILKAFLLPLPKEKPLESVILKNFDSHRTRNNKTSLMFSIALAFLIFSGTGFRLNANIISQQLQSTYGSDLSVMALGNNFLNETNLRDNLEKFKLEFPDLIQDYAFVSQDFTDQAKMPEIEFSSLSGTPIKKIEIVSVDESYLNSIYENLFVPDETDPRIGFENVLNTNKPNIVKSLYSQNAIDNSLTFDSRKILTNSAARSQLDFSTYFSNKEVRIFIPKGLSLDSSVGAETSGLLTLDPVDFKARVRGVATKLPGFFFTGYKTFSKSTVVTSHEDYQYMRQKVWNTFAQGTADSLQINNFITSIPSGSSYGIAKTGLLIRYKSELSESMRLQVVNTIETLVNNQFIVVTDVVGTITSLQDSLVFIDIFFILVAFIAVSLSFFFTIISFVSNIRENSWEFGVLRAIGLSKKQMTRIYVFEATSLILGAAILGTIVGILVAITSNTLFFLFTELPFTLEFPLAVFLVTLVTSLLTAVFGSKMAVDDVKDKQISTIIKALD